jgi:hypothetical protein
LVEHQDSHNPDDEQVIGHLRGVQQLVRTYLQLIVGPTITVRFAGDSAR